MLALIWVPIIEAGAVVACWQASAGIHKQATDNMQLMMGDLKMMEGCGQWATYKGSRTAAGQGAAAGRPQ